MCAFMAPGWIGDLLFMVAHYAEVMPLLRYFPLPNRQLFLGCLSLSFGM